MLIPYWEDNCYNDAGDKMKKKKLILFDMDGTLIDWRQGIDKPTKQMFEAFQKLREHGFLVMIASGRLLPLITVPLRGFEYDGYLLSDGAHVILNGEEIIKEPLDHGDVERTISLARSLTLEYGLLFKDGAYLQKDGVIAPFLKKANFDMNKINYEKYDDQVFKLYIHCQKKKQNEIIEQFGCFNLAFEDDYDLIEIRNKYHSKASGLKAILTRLEIETENTYFFGDGFNDVEIFNMVGHSYVMENAAPELYQYGTICQPVEADGAYLKVMEILAEENL